MKQSIEPMEIVAWMREQSLLFDTMADQIEATFRLGDRSKWGSATAYYTPEQLKIRRLLKDGISRRTSTIAKELGIGEEAVADAVKTADDLNRNIRGWISFEAREVAAKIKGERAKTLSRLSEGRMSGP